MRKTLIALLQMLLLWGVVTAVAADSDALNSSESPWRFGVALGYGERSNPLALSDDITIIVDLDIAWFGEHWFFDNGDLGLTVMDTEHYTVNLIGQLNSDRVFFSKTNSKFISVNDSFGQQVTVEAKVPDRNFAFELGVEFLSDGEWGNLQAAAFRDVSGTHGGYEVYADYSYSVRRQRWLFTPSFGASWKSGKLNNYYWGVQQNEASDVFPAYHAGAGLNTHLRLMTAYQINSHWAFVAVAEYERLNSKAAASPFVEERGVLGMFTGFKYEY